jgi:hypothetical protein
MLSFSASIRDSGRLKEKDASQTGRTLSAELNIPRFRGKFASGQHGNSTSAHASTRDALLRGPPYTPVQSTDLTRSDTRNPARRIP